MSHDVIGLAADPTHGAVSSRSLSRTIRRLHARDDVSGTAVAAETGQTFEDRLDADAKQMYRRPWNKLELGMKWIKTREFCEAFAVSNKLTDTEKALLVTLMRRALDAKLLNTKSQIEYSPETERITTIFGLHELPKNEKGDRRFGLAARGARTTRKKKAGDSAATAGGGGPISTTIVTPIVNGVAGVPHVV